MSKKKAKISQWKINQNFMNPYKYSLQGVIVEDEIDRGFINKVVSTSTLIKIDFDSGIAETKNTIYNLI